MVQTVTLLLSQYDVGTIPPVLDAVTAGPVSAMRCQEVDHLILLESPPIDRYTLPTFKGQETVHAIYPNEEKPALLGCPFGSYTVLTEASPAVIIRFADTP